MRRIIQDANPRYLTPKESEMVRGGDDFRGGGGRGSKRGDDSTV